MQKGQVVPFAEHREARGTLYHLFNTRSDHGITVGAHQNDRAFAQRSGQIVAAFHCSYQPDSFIHRRAIGGEKLAIVVHGLEFDWQHAENRAPLRVGWAPGHDVRARLQDASMDGPLVWRSLRASEVIAVEVLHDQPVERYVAGADVGDGDERIHTRYAHGDVPVAIGYTLVIENMAGGKQFFFQLFQLG